MNVLGQIGHKSWTHIKNTSKFLLVLTLFTKLCTPLEVHPHYISTINVCDPSKVGVPIFSIHTTLVLSNVGHCC